MSGNLHLSTEDILSSLEWFWFSDNDVGMAISQNNLCVIYLK